MVGLRMLAASLCFGLLVGTFAACGAKEEKSDPPFSCPDGPFECARKSVIYIETDLGMGSGVAYDERGHIITNYHVIAHSSWIEVVPPDGNRIDEVSVVGFDRQADVAVLRIPDHHAITLWPIEVADLAGIAIADPVYALGFPFEGGAGLPVIQLSAGVVSAKRQSVLGDVAYIQTDASFNAGLSGGALVDDSGKLVGIPTFVLDEGAAIGLAIEAGDVLRIAEDIISSETGDEPLAPSEGRQASGVMSDLYDATGYKVWLEEGERFEAALTSDTDAALSFIDPFGYEVAHGDELDSGGAETLAYDVLHAGPYTLSVLHYAYDTAFDITASHDLTPFIDTEDGNWINLGRPFIGELQFAGDEDTLLLDLEQGETMLVTLRSWDFDPYLLIRAPTDPSLDQEDDDSGWGLLGTDAEIQYTAEEQGVYEIIVVYAILEYDGELLVGHGFYRLDAQELTP